MAFLSGFNAPFSCSSGVTGTQMVYRTSQGLVILAAPLASYNVIINDILKEIVTTKYDSENSLLFSMFNYCRAYMTGVIRC